MSPQVAAELSPGIRDLVLELHRAGFRPCDSGDGSNAAAGMECALPFRHVFMLCPAGALQSELARLRACVGQRGDAGEWDVLTDDPSDEPIRMLIVADRGAFTA